MNKLAKILMVIALAAPLSVAAASVQAQTVRHHKVMTVAAVPTQAKASKIHHVKHHAGHKAHAKKHTHAGVKHAK